MTTSNEIQIKYIMPVLLLLIFPALIGISRLPQENITTKDSLLSNDSHDED